MITQIIYLSILPFSFLFSLISLVISFKYITNKNFSCFFLYFFCSLGILIGKTVEFFAKTEAMALLAGKFTYAFIAFSGVFWLLFICQWTHHNSWLLKKSSVLLLCIIPVITILLQSTNNFHHLIWEENHFEIHGNYLINVITKYGPWFFVHSIYSYGLFITGCIILCIENSGLWKKYKLRTVLLISGISFPVLLSLVYILRDTEVIFWDFSAGSFAITTFLFSIVFVKFDFFTLPQPSRKNMIKTIPFGLTTLTSEGIIVDFTSASAAIFGTTQLFGQNIKDLLQNEDRTEFILPDCNSPVSEQICICNNRKIKVTISGYFENEKISSYVLITKPYATKITKSKEELYEAIYQTAVKAQLSKRELELLKELLGEETNKTLAAKLNITSDTIHTHISRILKKLNCKNRKELREYAESL